MCVCGGGTDVRGMCGRQQCVKGEGCLYNGEVYV